VFHIGFFKTTIAVLQCICKKCSRVLLSDKVRKRHLTYMRDPRIDAVRKAKNFKAITDVRYLFYSLWKLWQWAHGKPPTVATRRCSAML
jgi:DNA-directed RNA polymerase beta' subunit